ncbi:MAG: hypothetical protein V7L25_14400 [Nostoc sp.]
MYLRLNSQFWFLGDVYDGLRLRTKSSILDVTREVYLSFVSQPGILD